MAHKPRVTYLNGIFFPVFVGVCFSESDYLAEMKRMGVNEPIDFHSSTASMKSFTLKNKLTVMICFDPVRHRALHKPQVAALIAHEAVHVSDAIFCHVGEDNAGDETRAYLVQYIVQETLYMLNCYTKNRRKHGKER